MSTSCLLRRRDAVRACAVCADTSASKASAAARRLASTCHSATASASNATAAKTQFQARQRIGAMPALRRRQQVDAERHAAAVGQVDAGERRLRADRARPGAAGWR